METTEVSDPHETETETANDEEADGADRTRLLITLTEDMDPQAGPGPRILENVPSARDIAAAAMEDLRRLEIANATIREALSRMGFGFQWVEDDSSVEVQVALGELRTSTALVDDLRCGLLRWLQAVGYGPVIALDADGIAAVRKLEEHLPPALRGWPYRTVKAAIEGLAERPDAGSVLAKHFQKQRLEIAARRGHPVSAHERRTCWPWRNNGGSRVRAQRTSRKGNTSHRGKVQGTGRHGKAVKGG